MKKAVQIIVGLVIGALLLWWVFRDTDWAEVGTALGAVHWGWLAVATLFVLFSFITRILRWRYIVRTAKPVSFRSMFSATQIGFMANFILPGRAGEVIRALVLSRGRPITPEHLRADVETSVADPFEAVPLEEGLHAAVARLERSMIERALARAGGNRSRAAELLKINRRLLYDKMREFGLLQG